MIARPEPPGGLTPRATSKVATASADAFSLTFPPTLIHESVVCCSCAVGAKVDHLLGALCASELALAQSRIVATP